MNRVQPDGAMPSKKRQASVMDFFNNMAKNVIKEATIFHTSVRQILRTTTIAYCLGPSKIVMFCFMLGSVRICQDK